MDMPQYEYFTEYGNPSSQNLQIIGTNYNHHFNINDLSRSCWGLLDLEFPVYVAMPYN
jgi:hypothetical protein